MKRSRRIRRLCVPLAACCQCLLFVSTTSAQDKKDAKKEPKVLLTSHLVVPATGRTTVKLRGLELADATAVKVEPALAATLKGKGKSEGPKMFEAPRTGDSHVDVELDLKDAKPGPVTIAVVTPGGTTNGVTIHVEEKVVEEKEPNNGFRAPNALTMDQPIYGSIASDKDVDVYRLELKSGQRITVTVDAAKMASLLDAALTIYNGSGQVLATSDDPAPDAADPTLTFTAPTEGPFFLAVIDANDKGTAFHTYRLLVTSK
jgi:hypothetical protein